MTDRIFDSASRGRSVVLVTVVALLGVGASACSWFDGISTRQPSRLIVVLADVSSSTDAQNWDLARRAYDAAVNSLKPGDRFVLAGITDASLTRFDPVEDRVLEVKGIHLTDQELAKTVQKELAQGLDRFGETRSSRTRILDAIDAVGRQVIAVDRARRPVLVILSDMLEVSEHFNFERTAPSDEAAGGFIEARRAKGALPDISGTSVYVVGATAPDERHYTLVERFWTAYFEATGAKVGLYGRTIPRLGD